MGLGLSDKEGGGGGRVGLLKEEIRQAKRREGSLGWSVSVRVHCRRARGEGLMSSTKLCRRSCGGRARKCSAVQKNGSKVCMPRMQRAPDALTQPHCRLTSLYSLIAHDASSGVKNLRYTGNDISCRKSMIRFTTTRASPKAALCRVIRPRSAYCGTQRTATHRESFLERENARSPCSRSPLLTTFLRPSPSSAPVPSSTSTATPTSTPAPAVTLDSHSLNPT